MTTVPYSSSDYLKTDEDIIEYLNAAVEDGDNSVLLLAMRNVAINQSVYVPAFGVSVGKNAKNTMN